MKEQTPNEQGFTLIEVLIALLIFIVGIMAVNSLQLRSTLTNTKAGRLSNGTQFAQEAMENLIAMDWSAPEIQDSDGDGEGGLDDLDANADGTLTNLGTNQTITLSWNIADDVHARDTKTIRVFATYATTNAFNTPAPYTITAIKSYMAY